MSTARLARAENSTLVVIDIQERLASVMPARESVVRATGILLEAAGRLRIPVIVTEQYPTGLGHTVPELTAKFPEGTEHVEKSTFSACGAIALSRPQAVLAGMEAHVCVLQTALELIAAGHEVYVVADAICSRAEENRRNAIDRMRAEGVVVTSVESVLFEWLKDSSHAEFRTISKLVK